MDFLGMTFRGYVMMITFYFTSNLLFYTTVRKRLRGRWYVIVLLTLAETLLADIGMRFFWGSNIIIGFLFFYFCCKLVDAAPYKLMYLKMLIVTYTVVCNLIFYMRFGSSYTWGWPQVLWMLLCFALTIPLMMVLLRKIVWPRLDPLKLPVYRWLVLVPSFVIIVNMASGSSYLQYLMSPNFSWVYGMVALLVIVSSTGISLLVITIMRKIQDAVNYQNDLALVDMAIAAQARRYAEVLDYVNDVRVLRHDMRHHMIAVSRLAKDGKQEELLAYLREYEREAQRIENVIYSSNYISDLIAHKVHFAARDNEIAVTVQCGLPETFWISETDLCVLLGNLTENALNACRLQQGGAREIIIRTRVRGEEAFIEVENTRGDPASDTPEQRMALGIPQSGGFGQASVEAIAKKYKGLALFDEQPEWYKASVVLCRPKAAI